MMLMNYRFPIGILGKKWQVFTQDVKLLVIPSLNRCLREFVVGFVTGVFPFLIDFGEVNEVGTKPATP